MVLTRRDVQLRGPPPKDSTIVSFNKPDRHSCSILYIRHCLRIVVVVSAALLFVFRTYDILMSSTRFPEIVTSLSVAAVDPARVCKVCKFLANFSVPTNSTPVHVRMNSTGGYGRTGNYFMSMTKAMTLGYMCKSVVELPSTDEKGAFLHLQERLFDFSQRVGEVTSHALCEQELVEGDAKTFWYMSLPSLGHDITCDIRICLRQYIGFCTPGFCSGQLSVQDGVLTISLRQGDIYKPNFEGGVHPFYQQPFLAYYNSIINFTKPELVLFVGDPSFHGPVWDMFDHLHSVGATKYAIKFQSSNFTEDLKTMVCARQFVESKSSLMHVASLGFATQRFSHRCLSFFPEAQQVYYVESGEFNGGRHDNSAEEWVSMLLHGNISLPRNCDKPTHVKSDTLVGT